MVVPIVALLTSCWNLSAFKLKSNLNGLKNNLNVEGTEKNGLNKLNEFE